jgi:hypothetical protein
MSEVPLYMYFVTSATLLGQIWIFVAIRETSYRVASLTKNRTPLGPYSRNMPS